MPLASSQTASRSLGAARFGAPRCPAGMLPKDAAKISAQREALELSLVPILPV